LGLSRVYCLCSQICRKTVMCTVTCSELNGSTKPSTYARYLRVTCAGIKVLSRSELKGYQSQY